jgi:DNA-binding PadR family transcriptional regulator
VAEQYFFLSERGRNTVYFALTPDERAALRRLRDRRWRDLNLAFSEQRRVNRQRREPVEQTA